MVWHLHLLSRVEPVEFMLTFESRHIQVLEPEPDV